MKIGGKSEAENNITYCGNIVNGVWKIHVTANKVVKVYDIKKNN
jgi:hypothetical protein